MGSSGCGKTTLINCMVGISKLDSGKIKVFGSSVLSNIHQTGYMPQQTALIQNFKIKEIFFFFGVLFNMTAEDIQDKINFLTDLLQLPESDKFINTCSGGEKRRISFAISLINDPDLLILDEPTVGVDSLLREKIWKYLINLSRTKNVTIFLTTHYIEETKQSDKVGLMRKGVLIAEDTPNQILKVYEAKNMEEAFLRLSEKHEVSGEVKRIESEHDNEAGTSRESMKSHKVVENLSEPNKIKILKALLSKHYLELFRNLG
jgi:ABC-type multidrug transport system ATPase subunit